MPRQQPRQRTAAPQAPRSAHAAANVVASAPTTKPTAKSPPAAASAAAGSPPQRAAKPLPATAATTAANEQSALRISGITPSTFVPMAPIITNAVPQGPEWLHQLKWDGIRLIADCCLTNTSSIRLYTKRMVDRTASFSSIQQALMNVPALQGRSAVLDGEAVVIDPQLQRPSFSLILQRQRSSLVKQNGIASLQRWPLWYVLFDLIALDGQDLRALRYEERHQQLLNLFTGSSGPNANSVIRVADVYNDGLALWSWVEQQQWEGVVSKLRDAPYSSGKQHQASFKCKKQLEITAEAYGMLMNEGRLASLVIFTKQGVYLGRVSIGLQQRHRTILEAWAQQHRTEQAPCPANSLPTELRRRVIQWFHTPIPCLVSALEMTETGLLRHPKLLQLPFSSSQT